jgi:hypothetical protein
MPMKKEAGRLRIYRAVRWSQNRQKPQEVEAWLDTIEAIIRVAWLPDDWLGMV